MPRQSCFRRAAIVLFLVSAAAYGQSWEASPTRLDDAPSWATSGVAAVRAKDWRQALAATDQLLALQTTESTASAQQANVRTWHYFAHLLKAFVCKETGQWRAMLVSFQAMIRLQGAIADLELSADAPVSQEIRDIWAFAERVTPDLACRAGELHVSFREYDDAIAAFRLVTDSAAPVATRANAYRKVAEVYLARCEYPLALQAAQRAHELAPSTDTARLVSRLREQVADERDAGARSPPDSGTGGQLARPSGSKNPDRRLDGDYAPRPPQRAGDSGGGRLPGTGRVLSVEANLVRVDLGRRDGVKEGSLLSIRRNTSRPHDVYAFVEEVQEAMCVARLLSGRVAFPAPGDSVRLSTQR